MREIKFRGKRIDSGKWVYGFYFNVAFKDNTKKHFILPFENDADKTLTLKDVQVEVIEETVGQFTGLKDKNGVEIHEGDIVKSYLPYNANFIVNQDIVMFDENECTFIMGNGVRGLRHFYKDTIIEVIGNIHDNKELL